MGAIGTLSGDDLIVVTGGAGFIGSHVARALAAAGLRVVISDLLRTGGKWRNIAPARLYDVLRPDELSAWLGRHGSNIRTIVHMAAISSTALATRRPDLLPMFDQILAGNLKPMENIWYPDRKSLLPSGLGGVV